MDKIKDIILESSSQEDLDTNIVFVASFDINTESSELEDTLEEIFYDVVKMSKYDVEILDTVYADIEDYDNYFYIVADRDYPDKELTDVYIHAKAENEDAYEHIVSKIRSVLKTCGNDQLSDYSKNEYEDSNFEITYEYSIY